MTETLFTALLLATLLALLLAGRSGRWGWALLAGLLLGAAALTRPVAQALVVLVPLAFLLYTAPPLADRAGHRRWWGSVSPLVMVPVDGSQLRRARHASRRPAGWGGA